jgi:hypothetical protein
MPAHKQLLSFGAMFLLSSLVGFINSANPKAKWYFRYIAFALGATFLVLGILIPMRLWNM